MMLVALFLAVAAAVPQRDVAILRQTQEQDTETGNYRFRLPPSLLVASVVVKWKTSDDLLLTMMLTRWIAYSYEADNGIKVEESGVQKQIGFEAGTVSRGSYSFPADGESFTVNWVADENGFQARGSHLPTPPPVPEHVVKLLADLRAAGLL